MPHALAQGSAPVQSKVVVRIDQLKQTVIGFGGAFGWYGNWLTGNPSKDAIFRDLFSRTDGAGLTIIRIRDIYHVEPPTFGSHPGSFDPVAAEIVRRADQSAGRKLQVLLTAWAPPPSLKSNGVVNNGGTLASVNGAFVYSQFGDFWRDSVAAYRAEGVDPTYVSIQNEPDFKATWDSCILKPSEETDDGVKYAGYDKALDAAYKQVETLPSPPKFIGPECIGIGYHDVENYLNPKSPGYPLEMKELYGVAHHLYHGGTLDDPDSYVWPMHAIASEFPGKPKMQTECTSIGLVQTAGLIHESMAVENASVYLDWDTVWNHNGIVTLDNPDDTASWKLPNGYALTDTYYGMRHFSQYVEPGDRRVDASSENSAIKVTAYLSPDARRLTMVLINLGADPASLSLDTGAFKPSTSAAYLSVEADPTKRFEPLGPVPVSAVFTLPARSVATIVFRR
jgi:glucuronoarabinoxylan endo-1,4-beta-xylanase